MRKIRDVLLKSAVPIGAAGAKNRELQPVIPQNLTFQRRKYGPGRLAGTGTEFVTGTGTASMVSTFNVDTPLQGIIGQ